MPLPPCVHWLLQELRGAFEESRDHANSAAEAFGDLQLRHLGEHGRQLGELYVRAEDALGDRERMGALWERAQGLPPGTGNAHGGVAAAEVHWDARKGVNSMRRWVGRASAQDAARLRAEAYACVAQQQSERDVRRRAALTQYRV